MAIVRIHSKIRVFEKLPYPYKRGKTMVPIARKVTSVPLWTIRKKTTNGKFSATESGFSVMVEALRAIKLLEKEYGILLPGEPGLLSSGHLILEVESSIASQNGIPQNPGAVTFDDLMRGIRLGDYPRFNSIIPPVFGYTGADQGGLISKDEEVRQFTKDLLEEAILMNLQLLNEGLGEGITIVWPAYMSFLALDCPPGFMVSNDILMGSVLWERFLNGICEVLSRVKIKTGIEAAIHLEWKVNDPGLLDIIPTLELAIRMCDEINSALGWKGAFINNEWAHLGLSGIDFATGTCRTIEAGLFDRLVHVNGGTIHTERLEAWLIHPFHPADWPGLVDPDWPVGFGSEKITNSQQRAINQLVQNASDTGQLIILEHDVFHAPGFVREAVGYGIPRLIREPFDVLVPSVLAANAMWEKALEAQQLKFNLLQPMKP